MSKLLFSTLKEKSDLYLAYSLCDGLEDKNLQKLTILLKNKKANPNIFMPLHGITPFHLVIGNESEDFGEEVTKLFLQYGGNPNVKSIEAMTPVHVAAAWGKIKVLEILLAHGGDPLSVDIDNCTPFYYAFHGEHYKAVSLLSRYCLNKESVDKKIKFKLQSEDQISKISFEPLKPNIIPEEFKVKFQFQNSTLNMKKSFVKPAINESTNLIINNNSGQKSNKLLKNSNFEKKTSLSISSISKETRSSKYFPVNKISQSKKYLLNKDKLKTLEKKKELTVEKTQSKNHLNSIFGKPKTSTSSIFRNNKILVKIKNRRKSLEINTNSLDNFIYNINKENEIKDNNFYAYTSNTCKISFNENLFFFKNEFIKLNSRSDIEILDLCNKSKSNYNLVKNEEKSLTEVNTGLNQTFFRSLSYVDFKKKNVTKTNGNSDNLICIKGSSLLETKDSFLSLIKFYNIDSYNDIQHIKDNDLKLLLSKNNNLFNKNNCSLHKKVDLEFFSMEEECKYEDLEDGVNLVERRLCVSPFDSLSEMNTSFYSCYSTKSEQLSKEMFFLDNVTLRKRLKTLGENPGPITSTTYYLYLKYLHKLESQNKIVIKQSPDSNIYFKNSTNFEREQKNIKSSQFSIEWIKNLNYFENIEQKVFFEFAHPDPSQNWREGNCKNSFNYLLLDPRITKDLPRRANKINLAKKWKIFLSAIFYIGKGKQSRPYAHLYDAFKLWISHDRQNFTSMKIKRIMDIWNEGKGVIVLHVFFNTIPVEAYTREAAMIEMLGIHKLGNRKYGNYYGTMATWKKKEKYELGRYLLFKALQILLLEGERQIFPDNL